MRIKIIGDNDCARATRHLVRLAGFAVTEFLPADTVSKGLHAGYALTIDLAPAPHTPDICLRPDSPTHHPHASSSEEAPRSHRDASSPAFAEDGACRPDCGAGHAAGSIHFYSVDSALGGGVLRGLLDLTAPRAHRKVRGRSDGDKNAFSELIECESGEDSEISGSGGKR